MHENRTVEGGGRVAGRPGRVLLAWVACTAAVLVLMLLATDALLLRGRQVASFRSVEFTASDPEPRRQVPSYAELEFLVGSADEPHTLILDTRPQELALGWSITSPEGWLVVEDRDILRRAERRRTDFVPTTTGRHVLRIERVASQPDSARGWGAREGSIDRVHVTVRENDRSFLWRLSQRRRPFDWLPL